MSAVMPGASKHTRIYLHFTCADDLAECKKKVHNFSKDKLGGRGCIRSLKLYSSVALKTVELLDVVQSEWMVN